MLFNPLRSPLASPLVAVAGVYGRVDAAPAVPLPLDSLTAGAAYSVRRLRTDYTGPLLRVRRSSDNTEQDIGYGGDNWLDEAALLTFVGAGSGFVRTWYDQSGNGRDVSQATTANQPRIVNAGVVDVTNTRPSLTFDGAASYLFNTSPFLYDAGASTVMMVAKGAAQSDKRILAEGNNASTNQMYTFQTGNGAGTWLASYLRNDAGLERIGSFEVLAASQFDGVARSLSWRDSGGIMEGFGNGTPGVEKIYTRTGSLTLNRFAVGCVLRTSAASFFAGVLAEIICFPEAIANSDFNLIGASHASGWGISVNPI